LLPSDQRLRSIILVEFYLVAIFVDVYEIWIGGVFARYNGFPILRFAAGVHDYAILIALVAGVAGSVVFKGSLLRGFAFPIVAYSVHEALFNIFFLSYHLAVPGPNFRLWWIELVVEVAVSVVALGFRMFQPRRVAVAMLIALISLTLVWMGLGFTVTTNIFDTASQNALNNSNALANGFEVAWNIVSLALITFAYKWR
jgi:hypothetical protein